MNYFNTDDISIPTKATAYELSKALNIVNDNNALSYLTTSFLKAQRLYNVNAIILISIACLESSFGLSVLARQKNNLFGIDARDSLKGTDEYGKYFANKENCINYAACRIGTQYLIKDNKASWRYCEGKKDIWSVGHKWSSDPEWGNKVTNIANKISSAIRDLKKETEIDYKKKYFDLLDRVSDIKNIIDIIDLSVE